MRPSKNILNLKYAEKMFTEKLDDWMDDSENYYRMWIGKFIRQFEECFNADYYPSMSDDNLIVFRKRKLRENPYKEKFFTEDDEDGFINEWEENPVIKKPKTLEARPTWSKRRPKIPSEREEIYQKYGAKAFLDPERRAYPVVDKEGHYDSMGILSAYRRAMQRGEKEIAQKALALAKKLKLAWAEEYVKRDHIVKK